MKSKEIKMGQFVSLQTSPDKFEADIYEVDRNNVRGKKVTDADDDAEKQAMQFEL